jgi:ketosteroid isomerase-like protein
MVSFEVERLIDGGDDIVMVGRCAWRNKATGRVVESPKVDIHSFRDGKVVRFQEVFDTLGFARALGAV